MNEYNAEELEGYFDFPPVDDQAIDAKVEAGRSEKKSFVNTLFPNDSLTVCFGFINEIKSHSSVNSDVLYFVRAGLIQGSRKNGKGDWVGDITNCDLLVGSTLKKWAENLKNAKDNHQVDMLSGLRLSFKIRNLKFLPEAYEGKPVLKSRGILEAITIGHIDGH